MATVIVSGYGRVPVPEFVAPPGGTVTTLAKDILHEANRYTLGEWMPSKGWDITSTSSINDWGGTSEHYIRHPAAAAFGLAVEVATGWGGGYAEDTGRTQSIRLSSSLAATHRANGGDWGGIGAPSGTPGGSGWQEALWAFLAGYAGWLLINDLTATQAQRLCAMLEHEADRFVGYNPPYWRNADGTENYPGDSKSEETAWNGACVALAALVMPEHPNAAAWQRSATMLGLATGAMHADMGDTSLAVNGYTLWNTLGGYNVTDDGLVINHGRVHPDYMAAMHELLGSMTSAYAAAGLIVPRAAMWHHDAVWRAFAEREFDTNDGYAPPGGTIYIPGSQDFYYPQGNDWGTERTMNRALADVLADKYGFDEGAPVDASVWAQRHLQRQADLQSRFTTGQTYDEPGEDTYQGREQWVAQHAASAVLALHTAQPVISDDTPQSIATLNAQLVNAGDGGGGGPIALTVLAEPERARIKVVVGGGAPGQPLYVLRRDTHGTQLLRETSEGTVTWPSVGSVTLHDYEAWQGTTATYLVTDPDGGVLASASVAIPLWGTWLKSPGKPFRNTRVYYGAASDVTRAARRIVVDIEDSPQRVVFAQTRGNQSGDVTVQTLTDAQADALRLLASDGQTLMLDTPPAWRVPYRYISVGDLVEVRAFEQDGLGLERPARTWQLTGVVEVDAPTGIPQGAPGRQYQQLATEFDSYVTIPATFDSYEEVAVGEAL